MTEPIEKLDDPAARLRWARQKEGYDSASAFAQRFGIKLPTYIGHENGARGILPDTAAAYAKKLKVRPEWLLYGHGPASYGNVESTHPTAMEVPLIDWVAASQFAETTDPYRTGAPGEVIHVEYRRGNLIALRVQGDSMDRIAPENSLILVDLDQRDLIDGKYYVFRLGAEATFKRYRAAPARLEPHSTRDHDTIFPQDGVEVVGRVVKVMTEL